ncbi:MAG: TIGR00268 family protein [Methanobrevibacter sp.]|nr:TIGR00268 family protein [Methanobrevibacter sp.]
MKLESKIDKVKKKLKNKKIAISFSGGADSTLICYLASEVASDVLAITVDNNILPKGFVEHTENFCKSHGVKQKIHFEDFYKHENIISNNHDRCYLCREEMYKHIIRIANENGFDVIVDGTNISDLVEDRPGILINYKNNIQSPFVDVCLTSREIHEYLDKNNIPYSKSTTCLATRVPFNEKFTKEKYERISNSENIIYDNTNCEIVKLREKYPNVIVEVDNIREFEDVNQVKLMNEQLKAQGYNEVTLKLEEIDSKKELKIDYENNEFKYQLPYEIDLKESQINNENIQITKEGLITGKNFNSYEDAKKEFMKILPKIRRLK